MEREPVSENRGNVLISEEDKIRALAAIQQVLGETKRKEFSAYIASLEWFRAKTEYMYYDFSISVKAMFQSVPLTSDIKRMHAKTLNEKE